MVIIHKTMDTQKQDRKNTAYAKMFLLAVVVLES